MLVQCQLKCIGSIKNQAKNLPPPPPPGIFRRSNDPVVRQLVRRFAEDVACDAPPSSSCTESGTSPPSSCTESGTSPPSSSLHYPFMRS